MKRVNFNIKDRKILYGILAIVLVSIFTLTIAYAALSVVLTIQGRAQVSSANWNIHLANPRVTSGSVTTDVPVIKTSSSLEFSTTLNMPGDFYEFTIDVVNDGSIDAMVENVIMTPGLTTEQAKYLRYEITYQNGESITTNQLITKGTEIPIKVRIEYRKDLTSSDLPTGQVVLDLSLELKYIQSDGTGSNAVGNGYKTIEFRIDGETYQAREGMTWGEFVNSNYNTLGLWIDSVDSVCFDSDNWCEWSVGDEDNYVYIDDVIEAKNYLRVS